MGLVHGWVQMQGYSTPEHKDTFALMGFNSSSTPSTATHIDLGSLPVKLLANHIGHEKSQNCLLSLDAHKSCTNE